MQQHRIVVANKQRLLRQMLRRVIEKTPDFQVVGEISGLTRLPEYVDQVDAQWVIVSLESDGNMPEEIETLLAQYPTVRVLAVASDGSHVKVKWVETHEEDLDNLSLGALVAALRKQSPWQSHAHASARREPSKETRITS